MTEAEKLDKDYDAPNFGIDKSAQKAEKAQTAEKEPVKAEKPKTRQNLLKKMPLKKLRRKISQKRLKPKKLRRKISRKRLKPKKLRLKMKSLQKR